MRRNVVVSRIRPLDAVGPFVRWTSSRLLPGATSSDVSPEPMMLLSRNVPRLSRLLPALVAALALGVPAAAHAAAPGVNVDSTSDQRIDAALATGSKLVRLFVRWDQLQPTAGGGYPSTDAGAANAAAGYDSAIRRLNAGGAKPIFVVLGTPAWANGGSADTAVPPSDPATYAHFLANFVRHNASVGDIAAYEVWNEEDAAEFWHGPNPGAESYAPLLKASYAAAKPVAGSAAILAGPTTANNAAFIQGLYDRGLKGSFDGVAVHTDTACLTNPPDKFIRDGAGGPINQYAFLGYRQVRAVMLANGDAGGKIWMTELGWSSTGGAAQCERGAGAGKGASGVSEAQQAAYLTQAYGCLAHDDYVAAATWFTLHDRRDQKLDEMNHYGLLDLAGKPKPAYAAFQAVAAANGGSPGPCGDFTAPAVRIITPTPSLGYTGRLLIQASGADLADPGVAPAGLIRLSFRVDGNPQAIGNYPAGDGKVVEQDYFGATKLADGKHTLTVIGTDANGNQGTASVDFYKGAQYVKSSFATSFVLPKAGKPACRGTRCTLRGRLALPPGVAPSGRVHVEWQLFVKQRVRSALPGRKRYVSRWVTFHKGGAAPNKPFAFRQKLKRRGSWRVRVTYAGSPPLKKAASPWKPFRV
jgi:hypothetical protein